MNATRTPGICRPACSHDPASCFSLLHASRTTDRCVPAKHTRIPVRYEGEPYVVYQARHVPARTRRVCGGRLGTYARRRSAGGPPLDWSYSDDVALTRLRRSHNTASAHDTAENETAAEDAARTEDTGHGPTGTGHGPRTRRSGGGRRGRRCDGDVVQRRFRTPLATPDTYGLGTGREQEAENEAAAESTGRRRQKAGRRCTRGYCCQTF